VSRSALGPTKLPKQ